MSKVSAATSVGDSIHTRTTADAVESQAMVLAVDGTDEVVGTPLVGSTRVVASAGASYTATAGSITTATTTVTTGNIGVAGNITVAIFGTYAGVSVIFEASPDGGTTWIGIGASREDTGGNEGAAAFPLPANTARLWTTGAPGFTNFRVRATAFTSLYVDLTGGTATTTTANSFPLAPGQTYVMDPTTFTTGLVTGIWAATGGNGCNVTEFS
jgi:hypothetical protein